LNNWALRWLELIKFILNISKAIAGLSALAFFHPEVSGLQKELKQSLTP